MAGRKEKGRQARREEEDRDTWGKEEEGNAVVGEKSQPAMVGFYIPGKWPLASGHFPDWAWGGRGRLRVPSHCAIQGISRLTGVCHISVGLREYRSRARVDG